MAMRVYVVSGLFVALGFGVAHFRASTDSKLRRVELMAVIGSFAVATGSAFLLTHLGWWTFAPGKVLFFLLAPLLVPLLTWAAGEWALRWSRRPALGLLGAIAGVLLSFAASGRFEPGRANADLLFAPLLAGAFAGYQVASGGRRSA